MAEREHEFSPYANTSQAWRTMDLEVYLLVGRKSPPVFRFLWTIPVDCDPQVLKSI
jgi:hypothetical protein